MIPYLFSLKPKLRSDLHLDTQRWLDSWKEDLTARRVTQCHELGSMLVYAGLVTDHVRLSASGEGVAVNKDAVVSLQRLALLNV